MLCFRKHKNLLYKKYQAFEILEAFEIEISNNLCIFKKIYFSFQNISGCYFNYIARKKQHFDMLSKNTFSIKYLKYYSQIFGNIETSFT